MILAIDIGNTNVKCKAWVNDIVVFEASINVGSVDELLNLLDGRRPSIVMLASVGAPSVEARINELFHSSKCVCVKSTSAYMGLKNGYDEPDKLGVDRWLALIEAYHCSGKRACCVIDLGTALTLDVVDAGGVHKGGFIAPGLTMMRESLLKSTEKVRYTPKNNLSTDYGLNTVAAVEGGTLALVLAWVESEIKRFNMCYIDGCVYLTGGMAKNILPFIMGDVVYEQDLILDALKRIASS